jgi:RNA polymerase sigma-70 factor (ECF subfamily)
MFVSSEARYNQWVRDHYRFLMRSAWALTGSRALAEDVVQDCYTNAWRHRDQLRDPALVRPWLFQIMRRSILRHLPPCGASWPEDAEVETQQAAPAADIDERLDVVKALGRIAPIHREVLVLHYFDDMSTAQIAEALEIAPGTVLSRLARAREALRQALEPRPANCGADNARVRPLRRSTNP